MVNIRNKLIKMRLIFQMLNNQYLNKCKQIMLIKLSKYKHRILIKKISYQKNQIMYNNNRNNKIKKFLFKKYQ